MGHLEDAALNVAVEYSVGEWALLIADLKSACGNIAGMKTRFPDNMLGIKVDVIVRLLGDLADNAEEKRLEASRKVTSFYKEHEESIEKAIKEQLVEQERINMFRDKMKPANKGGDTLFKEVCADETETNNSIFG